jgi:hypothetical protein
MDACCIVWSNFFFLLTATHKITYRLEHNFPVLAKDLLQQHISFYTTILQCTLYTQLTQITKIDPSPRVLPRQRITSAGRILHGFTAWPEGKCHDYTVSSHGGTRLASLPGGGASGRLDRLRRRTCPAPCWRWTGCGSGLPCLTGSEGHPSPFLSCGRRRHGGRRLRVCRHVANHLSHFWSPVSRLSFWSSDCSWSQHLAVSCWNCPGAQ